MLEIYNSLFQTIENTDNKSDSSDSDQGVVYLKNSLNESKKDTKTPRRTLIHIHKAPKRVNKQQVRESIIVV